MCILSAQESGQLEHWNTWPKCKWHHHCKKREAKEMVETGSHRWVGGEGTAVLGPVSMIVENRVTIWKPVSTSMPDGTRLPGLKTWGLASQR